MKATTLTASQKTIRTKMLATATKRNEKGTGYVLGDGYNQNWKKVLATLVERKELQTKKGKKGYFVNGKNK